jgi:hypothetical protein
MGSESLAVGAEKQRREGRKDATGNHSSLTANIQVAKVAGRFVRQSVPFERFKRQNRRHSAFKASEKPGGYPDWEG